jgi:hypothetical protein
VHFRRNARHARDAVHLLSLKVMFEGLKIEDFRIADLMIVD